MKASMYFNYTSRSLLRGGQRTMLSGVLCGGWCDGNCRVTTSRLDATKLTYNKYP